MEFYDDLTSFVKAYFDGSPLEIPHLETRHCSKKPDTSDQNLYEFEKLIERLFSGQVQEPLPPLNKKVIHETTRLQPTNPTEGTAYFDDYNSDKISKYNLSKPELPCFECYLNWPDTSEMSSQESTFHTHKTSIESGGYLDQVTSDSRK